MVILGFKWTEIPSQSTSPPNKTWKHDVKACVKHRPALRWNSEVQNEN